MAKMLEFGTLKELKANETLQSMSKHEWKKVKLEGNEVFACTTDQQYEDIICSGICEMLHTLFNHFGIANNDSIIEDLTPEIRDKVISLLEEEGIKFVDVFDEY